MARYYDLDKLSKLIEAKADTMLEGKSAMLYVAKWLNLLPAADVAPIADTVRKMQERLKANMVRRDGLSFKVVDFEAIDRVAAEMLDGE